MYDIIVVGAGTAGLSEVMRKRRKTGENNKNP